LSVDLPFIPYVSVLNVFIGAEACLAVDEWPRWTFLIAYYKANLEWNDNEASAYFRPFWMENVSHMFTYMDSSIGFIQRLLCN
jgi:hypothetical protein